MAGLNKLDKDKKAPIKSTTQAYLFFFSNFPFLPLSGAPAVALQALYNFFQSFVNLHSPGYVYSYRH